jgi:hypothetical protein
VRFRRARHRWDDHLDIVPIAEGLGLDDADQEILRQLVELGAQLVHPRSVRAYLYFRSEDAALRAARELSEGGWTAEVGAESGTWLVRPERVMVVSPESVMAVRIELTAVATRHGGDYDGWEASPQP